MAGAASFSTTGTCGPTLAGFRSMAGCWRRSGINGATVNNVNANLHTLDPEMIHELARIADAFRPWGVRMSLSVDLSSPQVVGQLNTFDPVNPCGRRMVAEEGGRDLQIDS